MTYKYYDLREEIINNCSEKELKKMRTWKDLIKLAKWYFWILFSIIFISIICTIVIMVLPISIFWCLIPFAVLLVCSTLFEYKSELFYNQDIRKIEKENYRTAYKRYVDSIKRVLEENDINNRVKREQIKYECLYALECHEKRFSIINNKIFDVLIGAPIGTLITLLVHKDNSVLINDVVFIIVLGASLIYMVKLIKTISFYSEGYLKDRQTLDALKEVEYAYSD